MSGNMRNEKLKYILKLCFLAAIEFIFCFTPLGSIPIGPIVATLALIPVIIASLTFGLKAGATIGFIMATFSFIYWTFLMPAFPTAFLFTPFAEASEYKGNIGSLIICFVPRVLSGIVPALVVGHNNSQEVVDTKTMSPVKPIIASILGSLTNTILVLIFIALFFGKEYSTIMGKGVLVLIGSTVITNGIPEAIVAAIVCPVVSRIIKNI